MTASIDPVLETQRDAENPSRRIVDKVRDVGTVAAGRIVRQGVMVVVMMIAARVLGQELLGVWALVYIVIQFGVLLGDSGISTYVVREKELDDRGFATAFYTSTALALLVAAIVAIAGVQLAALLGYRQHAWHFIVAGLAIVPLTMNGMFQSKLRRDRRFGRILVSDIAASATLLVGFIAMLSQGIQLWSLIVPTIVAAFVGSAICAGFTGFPKPGFEFARAKSIADYSLGLVGFSSIYFSARNADHVLIGRFLGAAPLGVYSLAYRIMMLPLSQINATAQTVALPYLAPHQHDPARLQKSLHQITVVIAMLTTLPMIWIWLERDLVVNLVLGSQWARVADLLAILAPLAVLQALVNPIGLCYQISGQTKKYFVIGLIHTVVTVLSFVVGVWIGTIDAVAYCYAIANIIIVPISVGTGLGTIAGRLNDWIRWCLPFFCCLPLCYGVDICLPELANPWLAAVLTVVLTMAACASVYCLAARAAFQTLPSLDWRDAHVAHSPESAQVG